MKPTEPFRAQSGDPGSEKGDAVTLEYHSSDQMPLSTSSGLIEVTRLILSIGKIESLCSCIMLSELVLTSTGTVTPVVLTAVKFCVCSLLPMRNLSSKYFLLLWPVLQLDCCEPLNPRMNRMLIAGRQAQIMPMLTSTVLVKFRSQCLVRPNKQASMRTHPSRLKRIKSTGSSSDFCS